MNNQIIFNDLLGQKSPMRPEPNPSSASNNSSDIKSRVGFSSQTSEYRKAFYHFQRLIQNSEQNAQQYNTRFQKNLNIKTQDILDSKGMADFFERQLFKLARNPKQLRKNWSEDETLLLLSLMAYFCCLYNEDFMNLVIFPIYCQALLIISFSLSRKRHGPISLPCIQANHLTSSN